MNQEVTNKVFEYVDALAEKLGVASEFVLGVMLKQQFIQGIIGILTTVILLLVAYVLTAKTTPKVYKWMKKDIERKRENSRWTHDMLDYPHIIIPGFAVLFILGIATGIHLFSVLPESINKLFNPEYFVIKEILNVFK